MQRCDTGDAQESDDELPDLVEVDSDTEDDSDEDENYPELISSASSASEYSLDNSPQGQ